MRMQWLVVVAVIGAMGLGGCAKREPPPAAHAPAASVPPPASSPLSKIKIGMSEQEVRDVLGVPTGENQHISGKQFIPWYFGPDLTRRIYFYKGMGRVVFSGTGKVLQVDYDPSETGVAR